MLTSLLTQKKDAILDRWRDMTFATYHPDTSQFLASKKDRFHNPVGHAVATGLQTLYEGLLRKADSEDFFPAIAEIIKIRSVQDFSPSDAVGFVFFLKQAIAEEIGQKELAQNSEEWFDLETSIDRLALYTFETYMACREKIYQIRVGEVRKMNCGKLWEEKNMKLDDPDAGETS